MNKYSSTPAQTADWLSAYKEALVSLGGKHRSPSQPAEVASLESLKRGVYAKDTIKAGAPLARDSVFFAMPLQAGQLESGEWTASLTAESDYVPNAAISKNCERSAEDDRERLLRILLQIRGMLNNARIAMSDESTVEVSHHYGLERFREFGAVIVNCVNREYCKKLVVQLPRQASLPFSQREGGDLSTPLW